MIIRRSLLAGFAILLTLVTTAQPKLIMYEKEWKRVDSLINKGGLTQSALKAVKTIYSLAKKEGNDVQVIKALLYHTSLQKYREDAIKQILQLEAETATSKEPAKALLQSITANNYLLWLQQNRWRLYGRTHTVNFKKDDLSTWGFEELHKKTGELYLASLSNEKLLQQTKLEPFDAIITKGNVRHLRPTLFDLLAHRALHYFKNNERDLIKPAHAFEINDAIAFADANQFMHHRFTTTDSLSLQFKALQLYQRLLQFHARDSIPDAFIDADIARVVYVYNNTSMENREALYAKALEQIGNKYGYIPAATQAWYYLAQWHAFHAVEYDPLTNDTNRYAYVKAKSICDKVIMQKDSSEGKVNCQNLIEQITRIYLDMKIEKVNIPGQPFRTLLKWRNFSQLHLRVVKIGAKTREAIGTNRWEDDYWTKLVKLPVLRSFSQTLPDTRDHQTHTAELKIDALPVGSYALIASVNSNFKLASNKISVQFFSVSNIAYIKKGNEFFIANRETGKPLPNAKVQTRLRSYDNKTGKYVERKGPGAVANEQGFVKITIPPGDAGYDDSNIEITTADDHLFSGDYLYSNFTNEDDEKTENESYTRETYLFADRRIYRPGQTIYFKGIVINRNSKTNEHSAAARFTTSVTLSSFRGNDVDSVQVTTNEFGAYAGRFTLPNNLLNGTFTLYDTQTGDKLYFSVEEYKRPTFLAEINRPSGTYKVNDTITVQGTSKAYAGNAIDGARVKYRVVRKTITPLWASCYKRIMWPDHERDEQEVTHGELTTDATGNFEIKFKAIPDNSITKKDQPTFYYTVSAEVTDAAGETRRCSTLVAVAYQTLNINLNVPDKMHTGSLTSIEVTTTNMNDLFQKTPVTVSIHKLRTPDRVFRDRYWSQPDTFVLSQTEYYSLFPYDLYKDENNPATWAREQKIWARSDSTTENKPFNISNTAFAPGWYIVEATTIDSYGEEVKDVRYLQLHNQSSGSSQASAFIASGKPALEPGEKAVYDVNTTLDDAFIIHEVTTKNDKTDRSFFTINKGTRTFEIPLTEKDRGGFGIQIAFIKHNRMYTDVFKFTVPYTNKELNVTYETFRDKTMPGSEEKWKVKISGLKGDKVAAEMLTAMYDASLDQFEDHKWNVPSPWNYFDYGLRWDDPNNFFAARSEEFYQYENVDVSVEKVYDDLIMGNDAHRLREANKYDHIIAYSPHPDLRRSYERTDGIESRAMMVMAPDLKNDPDGSKGLMIDPGDVAIKYNTNERPKLENAENKRSNAPENAVQVRRNMNETAFFFPHLQTDADGNIEFAFTMPEAVTKWKWLSLAHTKDLSFGFSEKTIVTQKDLMVQPNAPRFLREGDRMNFSVKIANITDKEITGQVQLLLTDAVTNQPVDSLFKNILPSQHFTVPAKQSVPVSFGIEIPHRYNKPLSYRIIAIAGNTSDGEEAMLPVLSNRMLVTESLSLPVGGTTTKNFIFDKLLKSAGSETLNHHALTVEYTSNPAWNAVQALPYLMEYPYECAEQTFNRYYANALAGNIANALPKLKKIFEQWKTADTASLLSNLQKNEALKSVLLQETPWVLTAKNEAQQKKNMALLFDLVRMSGELNKAIAQLKHLQNSNGAFAWFEGGSDDQYITQYILTGIGHLQKLKVLPANDDADGIIKKALDYLDNRLKEDHANRMKQNPKQPEDEHINPLHIQYLYMRSFFPPIATTDKIHKAWSYYRAQGQKNWLKQSRYAQGMIALSLFRTGDVQTARNIVRSLKENAITSEEMGMYWKEFTGGYYWYQSPIESQALMIEVFSEITADIAAVNEMKLWLLKQKQTQNWSTTRATADACYALLLKGANLLANTAEVTINLGNTVINSKDQQHPDSYRDGTGYFKKVFNEKQVTPEMGNIQITVNNASPTGSRAGAGWGAVYWQYFEDFNKITPAATPLQLTKKLFIEKNTDRGPVLQPLNEGDAIKVGDKVTVRIDLRADRNMEYVHMKDMRAACMEPVNVISRYKWQNGLGYYESTKDASTNFFFDELPAGTHIFEYQLFATHTGTFGNGITTIRCMYAPEFTSHSEGVNVKVE